YLLRRARLKSYSGRTSAAFRRRASAVLAFALFIVFALTACHLPCADQPNRIAPLREHYHEQTTPKRSSPSEWRRSSIIRPSGSPNTVTASSKETPCSHSNRGPRSTQHGGSSRAGPSNNVQRFRQSLRPGPRSGTAR